MKKTVLITGSTSGIGKAIAEGFAALGYNIVFNGLEADGKEIAEQIAHKFQIGYLFSAANMLYPADIRGMVNQGLEKFGSIDIVINNAGIQYVAPIEDFPDEKWDDIICINLNAAFHICKAVWPSMKKTGNGRIINIASAHGLVASEFKSAYVAAKHGLIGLTKTLALEGAPHLITCNAVCPGYVRTPIVDGQISDQMKVNQMSADEVVEKVMLAKQAIKEFIPLDLIVKTVLFLASDEASAITGISLPIDGGWTAQ